MKLDALELFVDVVRHGSFARVAALRNVAPSTVSRAIGQLEDDVGVRLLQRTTRRMEPTDAGLVYAARLGPLLDGLTEATQALRDAQDAVAGRVRVAASVTFGERVLVPAVAALRAAHPDVVVELVLSDRRVDLVAERVDVAIRHGALAESGAIVRRLASVRYVAVAHPEHLARHGPIDRPEDLVGHPLLAFSYAAFLDHWRFEKGPEQVVVPVDPVLTASNAGVLRAAARRGLGVALLADWTIADDLASGELVEVLPSWTSVLGDAAPRIWWMLPSRTYVPRRVEVFMAAVEQRIASIG
jgi:DNA-binding transcriptional LysR family regulator